MKMKKIASLALAFVLACSMLLPILPFAASAAQELGNSDLYKTLKAIDYTKKVYQSPEEKLATMTLAVENTRYGLYVQEYTAEVCVVDKVTGQMLFTNPYDAADSGATTQIKSELLSQIILAYSDGTSKTINSYASSTLLDQVVIKLIRGGIRVEYKMGEAIKKRIVPYQIEKSRFEEKILKPFFETTTKSNYTFEEYMALKNGSDSDKKKAEDAESFYYAKLLTNYTLMDPSDPTLSARAQSAMLAAYPITEQMAIYVLDEDLPAAALTDLESLIRENTEYSMEDLLSDHDQVGYEMGDASPAVFRVALEYTLDEDGLQVRLPARGITYDASTYTLSNIQILPYMGAGRTGGEKAIRQDDGYNFIPDGSGAIVDFHQNAKYTKISGTLYGSDFGFYNSGSTKVSQQVWRAPVFGTVMTSTMTVKEAVLDENGNAVLDADGKELTQEEQRVVKHGYVAFLTEGESLTRIDATDGGTTNEYHAVSMTFFARQSDSYPLDGITVSGGMAMYSKSIQRKYVGNYTIKYCMLWGEDASYVGMAEAYREFLIKDGSLEKLDDLKDDITLYLDLIGEVNTTKKVLGVPVASKAPITTFENAKTIYDELKQAGVQSQSIRYLGWANGGLTATAPAKLKVEKPLGGEAELKELIRYIQGNGDQVYLDLDFAFVNALKDFDGFSEDKDAVKTIDGKAAYYRTYNPIVQADNTKVALVISIRSALSFYENITEKYSSLYGESTKNMSIGSLGYSLNSNQDEDFALNREDAKDYTVTTLEKITDGYDNVLVEKGNNYTWKYADVVLDIPLDSSNRITATAEVPFLGIVLHGYMNYTGEAINLAGDYEYTLLKTLENGANPYFVVGYQNIPELKVNGYGEYYAVEYAIWKESIIEEYEKLNEVLAPLQDETIVDHQILGDRVVKVTYSNNTSLYLNYNTFAVTSEGLEIESMGFRVVTA